MAPKQKTPSPILEIKNLSVEFSTQMGVLKALDGVTLEVFQGETLGILGESGSGKSVTAQAIMALLPQGSAKITGGQINYAGRNLARLPRAQVRPLCATEIAMVFQDPLSSLNPVFRVGSQIAELFWRRGKLGKGEAHKRAVELMDRVGIKEPQRRARDYPHQFSGGMRQRIMIAMAIALEPKILIADEPTTALDVTVQAQILGLLSDLQKDTGMATMLITHDLAVLGETADRVAVMRAGRVVETGPIREVYDKPQHPYTRELLDSIPSAETVGRKRRSRPQRRTGTEIDR